MNQEGDKHFICWRCLKPLKRGYFCISSTYPVPVHLKCIKDFLHFFRMQGRAVAMRDEQWRLLEDAAAKRRGKRE